MDLNSFLNCSDVPENVKNHFKIHTPSQEVLDEIANAFNKSEQFDTIKKCEREEKEINDLKNKINKKLKGKYVDFFEDEMMKLYDKGKFECGRNQIKLTDGKYSMLISFTDKLTYPGRFFKINKIVYDFGFDPIDPYYDHIDPEEQIKLLKKFLGLLGEAGYNLEE